MASEHSTAPSMAWLRRGPTTLRRAHSVIEAGGLDVSSAFSDEVRRFVRTHICSMLQLEALLTLARHPERWWSAEALYLELRSSLEASLEQLEQLANAGLLETQPGEPRRYRFRPSNPRHDATVTKLMELRQERFHALVELIYSRDSAQEFADAFRLKKPEEDDG